jgi:hypothetical protein
MAMVLKNGDARKSRLEICYTKIKLDDRYRTDQKLGEVRH